MADLRAGRERAFWDHWRKSLRENPRDGLPAFLDELERIDEAHGPEPLAVRRADDVPSDAELTAWVEAHPAEFAAWARKQARVHGSNWRISDGTATVTGTEPPARPAARRRRAT